ncbi:MAG: monovalent cation/H+ antiporter subunit D family protein [Deltaproteobacteria bacterium]|nr:monovalent cation/H+ antiporter subunit D family protein [Deltaproteobacteria bacterium]
MAQQFPALIITIPLLAALFTVPLGTLNRRFCYPWLMFIMAAVLSMAIVICGRVITFGPISYHMGGWQPPWGIEYRIDQLNALMLVLISGAGLLGAIYSGPSFKKEIDGRQTLASSLYLLMITGLMGIVITGDLFNIFVFLEIASLSGYGLIASGGNDAPFATFRYIIMGTIGASCYLLGVGYLYISTGSLNLMDLHRLLPELYHSRVILTAGALMLVGIALKMALFPLHAWLPEAYYEAPSAVSGVAAPLYTKVAGYLMIRILYNLFDPGFFTEVFPITTILSWAAVFALLIGSIYAIAQTDLKKMLCYSVIAQVGYIVLGIALANRAGFSGAILTIINEVFTKACIFMATGAIIYRIGDSRIEHLGHLFRRMPITMLAFIVGVFSMIGIPPTCGFFSKLYLIFGCVEAGQWVFIAALLLSTILNVVYFFRVIKVACFEDPQPDYERKEPYPEITMEEAPIGLLLPVVSAAAMILITGLGSHWIMVNLITPIIPAGF